MTAIISLIAAVGEHLELGAKNELLWHLPDDFKWFVNKTKGHPIIMGRKTMESLGKPLKNRKNLVITRNPESVLDGFEFSATLPKAIEVALQTDANEVFIIGGGQVYAQSMDVANRLYITRIHGTFDHADTFFPAIDQSWEVVFQEFHPQDDQHEYSFEFLIFEKKA